MRHRYRLQRIFEITPGVISWGIIVFMLILSFLQPVACAILIIIFDFYWIIRTLYLTTLLVMAHRKLYAQKNHDWLADCQALSQKGENWRRFYQLIIFPVYKEGLEILRPSLKSLKHTRYPKEQMIVVVSFEDRYAKGKETARVLETEFKKEFFRLITTFHPDGLSGETRTKGANATWAAKQAQEFLDAKGILYDDVIVSCFDADTCVDPGYFGCLTYHFLTTPRPHQASYQPMPVYNNNIWYAPSFARLVEISASFCQLIESMRLEKFVTFSSHSMSFNTLVKINFWPVDMISDDSVVYWKAFIYYKGHYRVVPLYITVSMDIAYANNLINTIVVQYKQKRRWAWGVENFAFVADNFWNNRQIPFLKKMRRLYHLLESHITWAVWAIIITIIAPLPILLGGAFFSQMPIGYNLPRITGLLFNFTCIASFVWAVLSRAILPPRPPEVRWVKHIVMILEWILIPFIILILGSTPALDAQTRLMTGRYMEFTPTEKVRANNQKINYLTK